MQPEQPFAQPPYPPPLPERRSGLPVLIVVLIGCAGALCFLMIILAAILFPVFAQARQKARAATCFSNTKQMAMGIAMYAQDYDEVLPRSSVWMDSIAPYVRGADTNPPVFRCPEVVTASHGDRQQYGYAYNSQLSSKELAKIATPMNTIMLFESTTLSRSASDAGISLDSQRHGSFGPAIGYVDGHVRRTNPSLPQ